MSCYVWMSFRAICCGARDTPYWSQGTARSFKRSWPFLTLLLILGSCLSAQGIALKPHPKYEWTSDPKVSLFANPSECGKLEFCISQIAVWAEELLVFCLSEPD